jgi:hypothetical protein
LAAREFVFAASVLGDRVFGEFAGQLGEVIPAAAGSGGKWLERVLLPVGQYVFWNCQAKPE